MPNQQTQHQIQLTDKAITYQLRISKRSKHIRFTIHPQKGLVVSCPPYINLNQVNHAIKQKQNWITSKLRILKHQNKKQFQFGHRSQITLLGQNYIIQLQQGSVIRTKIQLSNTHLKITTPLKQTSKAKKQFDTWLKKYIQRTIINRVEHYAKKHNLKYNRITIKNQQTVWGSCSSKKNLNFSRRLIQLPLWLIDYVICHELAHLRQMNHSAKFWDQVENYYPNYKKARRHLKAYQPDVKLE